MNASGCFMVPQYNIASDVGDYSNTIPYRQCITQNQCSCKIDEILMFIGDNDMVGLPAPKNTDTL